MFKDLSGQRFGRLVVESYYETRKMDKYSRIMWKCRCDCGNETIVQASHLISGNTTSCGCYRAELSKEAKLKSKKLYNKYDLVSKPYGIGICTNANVEFYFDLEDFNKIKNYNWYYRHGSIATTTKENRVLCMHNLILPHEDNLTVMHIGGKESNTDNRKSNLKICTNAEKSQITSRQKLRSTNTSGITGVCYHAKIKRWYAHICRNGESKSKSFKSKEEAINQRKIWEAEFSNN